MLNIINYQRDANQDNEVSPYNRQDGHHPEVYRR